jgi:hypothetical protein
VRGPADDGEGSVAGMSEEARPVSEREIIVRTGEPIQPLIDYANRTPDLLSLLYDLGLMPEQALGTHQQAPMLQIIELHNKWAAAHAATEGLEAVNGKLEAVLEQTVKERDAAEAARRWSREQYENLRTLELERIATLTAERDEARGLVERIMEDFKAQAVTLQAEVAALRAALGGLVTALDAQWDGRGDPEDLSIAADEALRAARAALQPGDGGKGPGQ